MPEFIFKFDNIQIDGKMEQITIQPKIIGELVRCGECLYHKEQTIGLSTYVYCSIFSDRWGKYKEVGTEFFCAFGERRADDEAD